MVDAGGAGAARRPDELPRRRGADHAARGGAPRAPAAAPSRRCSSARRRCRCWTVIPTSTRCWSTTSAGRDRGLGRARRAWRARLAAAALRRGGLAAPLAPHGARARRGAHPAPDRLRRRAAAHSSTTSASPAIAAATTSSATSRCWRRSAARRPSRALHVPVHAGRGGTGGGAAAATAPDRSSASRRDRCGRRSAGRRRASPASRRRCRGRGARVRGARRAASERPLAERGGAAARRRATVLAGRTDLATLVAVVDRLGAAGRQRQRAHARRLRARRAGRGGVLRHHAGARLRSVGRAGDGRRGRSRVPAVRPPRRATLPARHRGLHAAGEPATVAGGGARAPRDAAQRRRSAA